MREILSKHDLRQLILLELLVNNRQNWLLLKDISHNLRIPIRTIHSDIKEINTYIQPLHVKASASGVKIVIPQTYSEKYIYKKILEESREFRIIEYIFVNGDESIESLSSKLYLSISTIKRMIKEINCALKKENFSIEGKPLTLVGNEQKLINFMSIYFSERYLLQKEYITRHQKELIDTLIDCFLAGSGKQVYFPNMKRISTRVYVSCIHLKNRHNISVLNPKKLFMGDILENKEFCDKFYETFSVRLTNDTIMQLFNLYSSENYSFNNDELNQLIAEDIEQRVLYNEVKKTLHLLSVKFNVPIDDDTENKLLLDIVNIINMKDVTEGRTFILYNRREYFLSRLFTHYTEVRNLIQNSLKENIPLFFSESEWNELSYILLTHWSEFYHKIRFIESPIKIFLLIDTDVEHGNLIKNELEAYSRYNIEIENIISYSTYQLYTLPKDSILVTNIPGLKNMDCYVLCFGEFLNNKDWQDFGRIIEDIQSQRKKYFTSKSLATRNFFGENF